MKTSSIPQKSTLFLKKPLFFGGFLEKIIFVVCQVVFGQSAKDPKISSWPGPKKPPAVAKLPGAGARCPTDL
jgi:hypothetical protein